MFENEIEKIKDQVRKRLESFFDRKIGEAKKIDPIIVKTARYLADQTLNGGKRIRAALAVQGYLAGGKKINPAIYDIGAAMELIHSYFLIHDDIIDQDDLRRGRPSMHCRFSNSLSKNIPSDHRDHLGRSLAILAGDISSVWAYELFVRSNFPAEQKIKALDEANQMIFKCGAGEMLDVSIEFKDSPKESDILKVQIYKTASYTIEGPLVIGAILGGAKPSAIKALREFARPLGIAFQIQDDILGLFGDEKEVGKPVGSDLRQGKMTLLIHYALKRADNAQKRIIQSVLGNENISEEQINNVRAIVEQSSSLAYSQNLVQEFSAQSRNILQKSPLPNYAKSFLAGLIEYLAKRSK